MERSLSPEEKIRRAEEIYYRRQNSAYKRNVATVNVSDNRDYSLFKKMILQILICLLIYFIFYLIQNSNYVFSSDVINKTKEILEYDINFGALYEQINRSMNEKQENKTDDNIDEVQSSIEQNVNQAILESAIGGAEVKEVEKVEEKVEEVKKEETNEEYIKNNFSFIKPVEGIVSSEFGPRNSSNEIVSKNHTGIDIAANTGTKIIAAMEGTVTVSSTVGDYGYHIKIVNNDITTLYGHCSELFVKEGEYVSQGQKIAEVGSTGKSTGPHLHFEIIRNDTYINPRDILDS